MISGWSTFMMTILAARRVFPPERMTPAKASYPFMKETGPLAIPPPESLSREPTGLLRLQDFRIGVQRRF